VHDGGLGLAVQDQAGRVGLRIAADDHHLFAGFGQSRDEVLCGGRLADATLTVDGALTQFCHDAISFV
jgi:hypothetical protein